MPEQYSKFQKIRWGALFLIALGIAGLALLQRHDNPGASLPVLGALPEFSLRAEDGRTVTRGDFVGRIVVTDFIFTHCAGTCPVMTSQMADLQKTFANEPGIILVSMSVDPERDTPQRLQQFAMSAGAKEGQWIFLTGGKTAVHH